MHRVLDCDVSLIYSADDNDVQFMPWLFTHRSDDTAYLSYINYSANDNTYIYIGLCSVYINYAVVMTFALFQQSFIIFINFNQGYLNTKA